MGDKDTDKLFGNPELLICGPDGEMKPLGKVTECSASFESEEGATHVPTSADFSITYEIPRLSGWFEERPELEPVKEAQAMLDRLRNYQYLWRKYYGFGMRKERRKIERAFNALAQRLVAHCKMYYITIQKR